MLVIALLAYGCPLPAIVKAFGFDERTVKVWWQRSGEHCRLVHEHMVEQRQFDLQQVQADEIKAKVQGGSVWLAMAMMVSTRLWLGGVISPRRDYALIAQLVAKVRGMALCRPLLLAVDGLVSYVGAFQAAFRSPLPRHGQPGRPQLVGWPDIVIVQVVKQRTAAGLDIMRRIVHSSAPLVAQMLHRSQGGTVINNIDPMNMGRIMVQVPDVSGLTVLGSTVRHAIDHVEVFPAPEHVSEVRLSTVRLENDAVVEPSLLLDEVPALGLAIDREEEPRVRASLAEALAIEPRRIEAAPPASRPWAASRLAPDDRPLEQFRGAAGPWRLPRVSVSRLERYLDCPFRFFASEVLRLEEQPEDEDTRTPLERGRFLHELWERFFAEWQRRGFGRITPQLVNQARELFEPLAEQALATLSPSEAALERTRLLGSALSPGIAHRVFAMEAERPADVRERLLEYPLQGDFTFQTRAGRSKVVTLSAKVDRIDLLQDGTLRVIDYKSKKTPDVKQALQLPLYSFVALESLRASAKRPWTLAEALYLSFEGDRSVVSLRQRNRSLDELVDEAKDRMLDTLDRIAAGRFPPQPAKRSLCTACPYRSVCRLEIVEAGRAESVDE
jgi:RecB family exonuclease